MYESMLKAYCSAVEFMCFDVNMSYFFYYGIKMVELFCEKGCICASFGGCILV
jgi:hypothetical protein